MLLHLSIHILCVYINIKAKIHTYIHIHIYICVYIYIYMCVYTCKSTHDITLHYIHAYTHTHTHIHIDIRIHTHIVRRYEVGMHVIRCWCVCVCERACLCEYFFEDEKMHVMYACAYACVLFCVYMCMYVLYRKIQKKEIYRVRGVCACALCACMCLQTCMCVRFCVRASTWGCARKCPRILMRTGSICLCSFALPSVSKEASRVRSMPMQHAETPTG